ncbi:class I SAM-dependent methyltransferase [Paenibacillus graminis]|uniref:class I SAM-dependent methyltransferase n=1 Tax=Paenibacillus graminis TaxID=189425 RepID=UPI002DB7A963|nr:methyltransferase domain-containing protein [Paenibacillus graminis]MEC0170948.1 methyltransferase domain-containing protein [Paenibacillus graminis]
MMLKEISKYWTSSSVGYDKVIQTQFRSKKTVRLWKQLLIQGIGLKSRQKVLDVGTGPGFFSILLSQMGHQATAVDASPGMIERASRNFDRYGYKVQAYVGDAADLSAEPDNSFDVVVCRDMVWTLPEPQKAYAEWHRILKPGGTLIVFDGNYMYKENRSLFRRLWYALSWMLILITEKRIRQRSSGDKSLLSELPFVNVLRPEADEQALLHAGFRIFDTRRNFIPARKLPLNYLKYGYENVNRFMIIAKKE